MKRNKLSMMLALGALFGAAAPAQRAVVEAPHRRPPGIRRYKAIDRIDRTKQHDQKAKLERRAARQANDEQTIARQKAKWG